MVEIVKEHFLSAIVCCDIDPQRPDCYDELDRQLAGVYNGTTGGWKSLRPTDEMWRPESAPLPCGDIPGRWHYVVIT